MNEFMRELPNMESLPYEAGEAALLNGHYSPPPVDRDGKTWVRASVVIQAHAKKLYQMWRDVEAASSWHERIAEVRVTGQKTSHWVMRDEPSGKEVEWDFEILADEPAKRIAWRCIGGEPRSAGVVTFELAPGGRGTMVTVLEQIHVGKFTRLWETITGRDPKQAVIENLRHFKAMAETGEIPRSQPRPHGARGTVAELKRATYGEKITTPPGTSVAEGGLR